jgi:iron complex transport system ATP-binding protein
MGRREVARVAAVVPQEATLPGGFTALDCVLMGRTAHLKLLENEGTRDLEAARRAMMATDTWPLAERRVGELSGGERQRVVVARALAQEARLLLLDEPTAHLDIGHQASVLGLVRRIAAENGMSVLAVVHDLSLAGQYCDRLVLLCGGRVLAEGTPAEVLEAGVLRAAYGVEVRIIAHPDTGRPVVAPVRDGA